MEMKSELLAYIFGGSGILMSILTYFFTRKKENATVSQMGIESAIKMDEVSTKKIAEAYEIAKKFERLWHEGQDLIIQMRRKLVEIESRNMVLEETLKRNNIPIPI